MINIYAVRMCQVEWHYSKLKMWWNLIKYTHIVYLRQTKCLMIGYIWQTDENKQTITATMTDEITCQPYVKYKTQ